MWGRDVHLGNLQPLEVDKMYTVDFACNQGMLLASNHACRKHATIFFQKSVLIQKVTNDGATDGTPPY